MKKLITILLALSFIIAPFSSSAAVFDSVQGQWKLANTTYTDDSGNGNTLIASGSPVAVAGFDASANTATDFEYSSSQYLNITDAAQTGLDITGVLTISAWIRVESTPDYHMIVNKFGNAGQYSYRFDVDPTDKLVFQVSNDGTAITTSTSTTTLSLATWYHVVAIYDGSNIQVYINNGSAEGVTAHTTGIFNSNTNFSISSNSGGSAQFFDGRISDVAIWSKALTSLERTELYGYGEDFYDPGEINGTVRDIDGVAINCATYNMRLTTLKTDGTFEKTQLVTSSNGTYTISAIRNGVEYIIVNAHKGTHTPSGEIDPAGAAFLIATPP